MWIITRKQYSYESYYDASECIQASLEKTEDKRYHSIAIPALCTGVFGYPANKATKVIVEAIRDFLKENGSTTCIRQIYLCDVKNDSVDHLVAALERFYNKANVTKQRHSERNSSSLLRPLCQTGPTA
jgi:O-acetyl-ADP-ribose deacetylase (regulator of RNase III)